MLAPMIALALVAACEGSRKRTRPVEVPISEFKVESRPAEQEGMVPIGTDVSNTAGESEAPEPTTVAKELDAKNGIAGVQLGASFRSFRGLKLVDKSGDRANYRVLTRIPAYGSVRFTDVVFSFTKGKLATMTFALRSSDDCGPMKEALERDLGAPQKRTPPPEETLVWRGDNVGLRFSLNSNGSCGGTLVGRDYTTPAAWAGLDP